MHKKDVYYILKGGIGIVNNYWKSADGNLVFWEQEVLFDHTDTVQAYDRLRIVRLLAGEVTWVIDGVPHTVTAGSVVLLNSTNYRMQIITPAVQAIRQQVIVFSPAALRSEAEVAMHFFSGQHVLAAENPYAARIGRLFELFREDILNPDTHTDNAAQNLLSLMLIFLDRAFDAPKLPVTADNYRLMAEIIAYIPNHIAEPLTVTELSRRFGISTSLFSKLFGRVCGQSFPDYVRRVRVANVIRLLKYGNKSILDAASESGFRSVSGFYKTFSEITGTTPTQILSENAEKWKKSPK